MQRETTQMHAAVWASPLYSPNEVQTKKKKDINISIKIILQILHFCFPRLKHLHPTQK